MPRCILAYIGRFRNLLLKTPGLRSNRLRCAPNVRRILRSVHYFLGTIQVLVWLCNGSARVPDLELVLQNALCFVASGLHFAAEEFFDEFHGDHSCVLEVDGQGC